MAKKRNVSIDFLKMLAILMVILIHTTANAYVESFQTSNFKYFLLFSSITSSAVPLFYMMSGAFMIKDNKDDFKKSIFKTLKLLLQTVVWTIIYYCIFKYILKWDTSILLAAVKSIFSSQVGHFWFIYPLLGLYILSPFISLIYSKLKEKEKLYLLLLIFLIPTVFSTLNIWIDFITNPSFVIGFPELGIFILGKYIYDNRQKIQTSRISIISFIGMMVGLTLIILLAYYYAKNIGISSSKPYFDYNKIPNVLFSLSLLVFGMSLDSWFEKFSPKIKNIITFIGTNTLGIYFIHMIFIYLFPNINIFGILFSANSGKIINMFLGAILYFLMSVISIIVLKKVPILKKLVD